MTPVVEEQDLDVSQFRCCGDENLYPFGCPECGTPMVFCYECDTLYEDLSDLSNTSALINSFTPAEPIFHCHKCKHEFPYWFIRDGLHKITRAQWCAAGFGPLLRAADST